MTKKVDEFLALSDEGRQFRVVVWQSYEPQRFGRTAVRNYPTIQTMETDDGQFVRRLPDGRFEITSTGVAIRRVESAAAGR